MMAPALGKVMELMLWGGENKRGSRIGDVYADQFKKYTTRHISAAAAVVCALLLDSLSLADL